MSEALQIWRLGDGKPGHENQSLGLVEALGRLRPVECHRIDLSAAKGFWQRWRSAMTQAGELPAPDLVLGAGHATHWPLWRLSRKHRAPSVVLMKPGLPLSCFGLCLAPRHDFKTEPSRRGLEVTEGALNRVVFTPGERSGKLILLGGPSKSHGWDGAALLDDLRQLVTGEGWQATDSRRTPPDFLRHLARELPQLECHTHAGTGPDWLPKQLQQAAEVWVSEDSVSMVYEALSSGAQVGLLPLPRCREDSRVLRGLDRLAAEGRVGTLESWRDGGCLPPPLCLAEADRCARLVLEMFFATHG